MVAVSNYTAFITENGHYEYVKLSFGLKNGPAVVSRYVKKIIRSKNLFRIYGRYSFSHGGY